MITPVKIIEYATRMTRVAEMTENGSAHYKEQPTPMFTSDAHASLAVSSSVIEAYNREITGFSCSYTLLRYMHF
jgi:hypothetical protein